ncbi:MAG: hypothetical protein ACE5FG_13525 [Myxococcota bacterium]
MRTRSAPGTTRVLLTVWFLATVPGAAWAQVQNSGQRWCLNSLNHRLLRVTRAQISSLTRCLAERVRSGPTGSAVEDCAAAAPALTGELSRTLSIASRRCRKPPSFGASDPAAVNATALDRGLSLVREIFGSDLDAAGDGLAGDTTASRCQRGVLRAARRCAETRLQEFNRCKRRGLLRGLIQSAANLATCAEVDPSSRSVRFCEGGRSSIRRQIARECFLKGVDLGTAFPGCGNGDSDALADCVEGRVRCASCRAVTDADGLLFDCDTQDDGLPNGSCGTVPTVPICGNDVLEGTEACDGLKDAACPGRCQADCRCPPLLRAAYEEVSAYGRNNVYDVAPQACDFERGCFTADGTLCAENPDQTCRLAIVPRGRCASGEANTLWPRFAGQCEGTLGYFEKGNNVGRNSVRPGGIPCLSDEYAQALLDQDGALLATLEKTEGLSSMCPVGVNLGGSSTAYPDATGNCLMATNNNLANCQSDDPNGNIFLGELDALGNPIKTFGTDICQGPFARCSDGDPDFDLGGLGEATCFDVDVLGGQIDVQAGCGQDAGSGTFASPRQAIENPPLVPSLQRDPGSGFPGTGPIRPLRRTTVVELTDTATAEATALGIRELRLRGPSTWSDAEFSPGASNGAADFTRILMPCIIPDGWETQMAVEGHCTHDPGIFCFRDADCDVLALGSTCIDRLYCHEQRDPNRPELGPVLDGVGLLWTRDIVPNESVPPSRQPYGWSTDPTGPSCPPLCGTAYEHTTLELEAVHAVAAQDRDSGI